MLTQRLHPVQAGQRVTTPATINAQDATPLAPVRRAHLMVVLPSGRTDRRRAHALVCSPDGAGKHEPGGAVAEPSVSINIPANPMLLSVSEDSVPRRLVGASASLTARPFSRSRGPRASRLLGLTQRASKATELLLTTS